MNLPRTLAIVVVIVLVGAMAGLGVGGIALYQGRGQLRSNATLLKVVLAVAGCTEHDTPAQCTQRQVDKAKAEGSSRVADVDCRIRLALAGLPGPPYGVICQSP